MLLHQTNTAINKQSLPIRLRDMHASRKQPTDARLVSLPACFDEEVNHSESMSGRRVLS